MDIEEVDRAVASWHLAMETLCKLMPNASAQMGPRGTQVLTTGMRLATLNGLIASTSEPDLYELGELARSYRSDTMPWSIQLRNDTGASAVALIASQHGLAESFTQPFMTKQLDAVEMQMANSLEGTIRRVSEDDYGTYLTVLASGFGVPKEDLSCFVTPQTLCGEGTSWFLLVEAGVPVATSLGVLLGNYVGVFNISTLPLHRRRGYARAATSLVLRDAYARGARAAFLQSLSAGKPLYESLGFATVENWRVYVAP